MIVPIVVRPPADYGQRRASATGAAVASGPALRVRELVAEGELHVRESPDDELGNAITVLDDMADLGGDGEEGDEHLAPIVGIDRTEGLDDTPASETAARADLGVEAGGNGEGESGGDAHGKVPDFDGAVGEAGVEVVAGSVLAGRLGQAGAFAQQLDFDLVDGGDGGKLIVHRRSPCSFFAQPDKRRVIAWSARRERADRLGLAEADFEVVCAALDPADRSKE